VKVCKEEWDDYWQKKKAKWKGDNGMQDWGQALKERITNNLNTHQDAGAAAVRKNTAATSASRHSSEQSNSNLAPNSPKLSPIEKLKRERNARHMADQKEKMKQQNEKKRSAEIKMKRIEVPGRSYPLSFGKPNLKMPFLRLTLQLKS